MLGKAAVTRNFEILPVNVLEKSQGCKSICSLHFLIKHAGAFRGVKITKESLCKTQFL